MRWISLVSFVLLLNASLTYAAEQRPNVLLIAIDDLNDWTGCLGGHPNAHTPHIDALAERGVLFTNAHCQAPICNPSRTSFMTGMRPSTTGIYMNSPWFRTTPRNRDRVTMGQHFAAAGYDTLTAGKIYHGSRVDGPSFATVGPRPGQRIALDKRLVTNFPGKPHGLWDFGPQEYDEAKFGDFVDATWAIEQLQAKRDKPFFLAVGFYRPHVPFYAPKRVFDLMPEKDVALPVVKVDDTDDLSPAALQLTRNANPPPHKWFVESGQWQHAVQSYLASTRFTDEQVGRLLKALDESGHAKNTIVVLLSDHGFHLGEKNRWAKQSLWERSTRVPFIISQPNGLRKATCDQPVELLSVFPTLVELCNLPKKDGLEGDSLTPLLTKPETEWKHRAITTYGQNNHSVRSRHWRYIRYADGSEELYDHREDPHEWKNLASDEKLAEVKAEHAKWLPKVNVAPAKGTTGGRKRKGKKVQ